MERNGSSGRVTSAAGVVGVTGDLSTTLGKRLRLTAGTGHAEGLDLEAHLARVEAVVAHARNRRRVIA